MPTNAYCGNCGAPYQVSDEMSRAMAGQTTQCPACGAAVVIPPVGASPPPPPSDGMPYGAVPPSWPDPRLLRHVRLIGIFNLIGGGLSGLTGLLWLAVAAVIAANNAKFANTMPLDSPFLVLVVVYGSLGLLSVLTAAVLIPAGILVLKRRRSARKWTFAAAIVSCVSIWTLCCLLWPLLLAAGVYSLVMVTRPGVRELMQPDPAAS